MYRIVHVVLIYTALQVAHHLYLRGGGLGMVKNAKKGGKENVKHMRAH